MSKLELRAGAEAYHKIQKDGLDPDMVKGVVSAAGGPKWFTIYGLTRYIISELLRDITHDIHFLGASVGSWQMASALTKDPGKAIDRLQLGYSTSIYSDKPDEAEISSVCSDIISKMLNTEESAILNHSNKFLHVVTARGKGLLAHNNKVLKGFGFGYTFITNAIARQHLKGTAERVVFMTGQSLPYHTGRDILPTTTSQLTSDNLLLALRASGSIPFMMEGIRNIPGGPTGMYWDGGMTDYHIALPYDVDGIILHPHFLPHVLPGWLDKKLFWNRKASPDLMSKVLLISPSKEYVQSLPRHQISDMKDFYFYGTNQDARIRYWTQISERSLELGEELSNLITSGEIAKQVKPYTKN